MSPSTPALRPQLQQQLLVLDAISFPSPPNPFLKISMDMRQLKIILLVWIYFHWFKLTLPYPPNIEWTTK